MAFFGDMVEASAPERCSLWAPACAGEAVVFTPDQETLLSTTPIPSHAAGRGLILAISSKQGAGRRYLRDGQRLIVQFGVVACDADVVFGEQMHGLAAVGGEGGGNECQVHHSLHCLHGSIEAEPGSKYVIRTDVLFLL